MTYRPPNSRKSDFATELPEVAQVGKDIIEGEVLLGFEDSLLGMTS
jgi:hypothetical protein